MGLYISLILSSALQDDDAPCCTHHNHQTPTGLPSSLDTTTPTTAALTAASFDKSLNLPESLMGLTTLRKHLASRARGHVLEVAVGTGRNLRFYDWSEIVSATSDDAEARAERSRERVRRMLRDGSGDVRNRLESGEVAEGEVVSFTGVDVSGEMVGVARDRVREAVPGLEGVMKKRRVEGMPRLDLETAGEVTVVEALGGRVRLVLGDAVRGLPAPPVVVERGPALTTTTTKAADKYDTIVQTFGLCSVADPARLLANMAGAVRPDTGRIVLLEHGRGDYEWMNRRVDKAAPAHFAKYGCWWNRDIEQLVREAAEAVPGLEVVSLERPLWLQFGTTLLIELKVSSQKKAQSQSGEHLERSKGVE